MTGIESANYDPFSAANKAAVATLASLVLHTIWSAGGSELVETSSAGPRIVLEEGYSCVQNSEVLPGIAVMSDLIIPDRQSLAAYVQTDAVRFPEAPRWREAAEMLTRVMLEPETTLPLRRTSFVYIALDPPHRQFNTGVAYIRENEEDPFLVLDTIQPVKDDVAITNLEVNDWMARLRSFRLMHRFPPLEEGEHESRGD